MKKTFHSLSISVLVSVSIFFESSSYFEENVSFIVHFCLGKHSLSLDTFLDTASYNGRIHLYSKWKYGEGSCSFVHTPLKKKKKKRQRIRKKSYGAFKIWHQFPDEHFWKYLAYMVCYYPRIFSSFLALIYFV